MQVAANSITQNLFLLLTSTTINSVIRSNNNNTINNNSHNSNHTIDHNEKTFTTNHLNQTTLPSNINTSSLVSALAIVAKPKIELYNPALGVFLSLFCFITVFGNGLVIYAILQERYLKSATYYYMASLACADLFVGLIVMPFAIVQVIFGDYWPFGKTCCDLWHSIDVCVSTASILDLCVIALDRYSAITNPIAYHRTFFVKRWPYLLVAVWLCSVLISFPAIAYWRLVVRQYGINRCLFPDDIYYILFSSMISFYIPLFVMIFVYIRIYRAAIKQMHAFKTGVKVASPPTKKKKKPKDGEPLTPVQPDVCLRIHRGKYHGIPTARDSSSNINHIDTRLSNNEERSIRSTNIKKSISGALLGDRRTSSLSRYSMPVLGGISSTEHHQLTISPSSTNTMNRLSITQNLNLKRLSQETLSPSETPRTSKTTTTTTSFGKRLTKFSKEQKATITLAYVMGIFVLCWLPFFLYNPLTAVAKLLIQERTGLHSFWTGNELVFQMFTWFGYVNSSVNPFIYAYSSREFRRAFIKYLCRCFPLRIRNFMMSYHNLHLLRYRRTPESIVSRENPDSGSDTNNNINNNVNKQTLLTTTTSSAVKSQQHKTRKHSKYHQEQKQSRSWLLTTCCSYRSISRSSRAEKRSSSTSSKTTTTNNNNNILLLDYCTYHDVGVPRVTCL